MQEIYFIEIGDSFFNTSNKSIQIDGKCYQPGVGDLNVSSDSVNFFSQDIDIEICCESISNASNSSRIIILKLINGKMCPFYRGTVCTIKKMENGKYILKCQSIVKKLNQTIGTFFSSSCRNIFGDLKCSINVEQLKESGTILEILGSNVFLSNMVHSVEFAKGIVTFGEKQRFSILNIKNNIIYIYGDVSRVIKQGQSYAIYKGCGKFINDCKKFNNVKNFNGDPFINT